MAADNNNNEILPLLGDDEPHFDVAMRGYDKRQVDEYVARAEAEIAETTAARDSALSASADRAAQLASREAHIESLTRQAAKASAPINPANVSERIREMLQLANEEAAQIRRSAEEQAEQVLTAARADAERTQMAAIAEIERLTAAANQRSSQADQKLAEARTEAATALELARAEASEITAAAAAERDRLDAEAEAARKRADQASDSRREIAEDDFEITLRTRRTAAERQATADHEKAKAVAVGMIDDARAEVTRLAAERDEIHETLRQLQAQLTNIIDGVIQT
jgi:DivIVA domain-containing protein